jgi:exopolysaccharide biosynthesis polyprenyl glycosylphosphotransferase
VLALVVGFLSYFDAYKGPSEIRAIKYVWAVFRALALSIGVLLALLFLLRIQYVSRIVIIGFSGMAFVALAGVRVMLRRYFIRSIKSGATSIRAIIIGTGERAKELSLKLREQAEWGIKIIGHLDPDPARVGWKILDAPVIGTIDDIHNILKAHVVDEIIIAIPRSLLADAEPIAYACEEEGIKLRFMADVFSLHVARVRLTQAGDLPLLNLEPVAQDEGALLFKRCFDLTVTLLSMPVVLPLMGIIALAIKLDSPGPVLFIQQRVGLKKRLFPMMKFRSMCDRAEDKLCEIEHLNEAEGPIFKMTDDPRITRVGRFIRKTSLDELPQLFNVIRGEMSLVGPRPMSIRDVDLFDRGIQRKRFSVKPGLTCIWQISGRSNLPFEKWLELDLQYIESWGLWLDFKILFKTIPAVLFPKGAW